MVSEEEEEAEAEADFIPDERARLIHFNPDDVKVELEPNDGSEREKDSSESSDDGTGRGTAHQSSTPSIIEPRENSLDDEIHILKILRYRDITSILNTVALVLKVCHGDPSRYKRLGISKWWKDRKGLEGLDVFAGVSEKIIRLV